MTMGKEGRMRTIKASEFKSKCLKLTDEVAETGEPLVITKSGKPIARLVPLEERRRSLWGAHKGLIEIKGDIVSPIDIDGEANL
jgi:prevent-host-death family protein